MKFQKLYNATAKVIDVRNMDNENFLNRPEVSGIFVYVKLNHNRTFNYVTLNFGNFRAICIVTALVILFSFANKIVENTNLDGLKRFFKCFSIYDNVASIYNTNSSPNSINSINGIR